MRRRGWKSGEWLVRDEESGFVEYGSNVRRDYYGVLTKKDQCDHVHPQNFVKAKNDPHIQFPQASPEYVYDTSAYNLGAFIGQTNIPAPVGPATHLFNPSAVQGADPGIGDMAISTTFVVR